MGTKFEFPLCIVFDTYLKKGHDSCLQYQEPGWETPSHPELCKALPITGPNPGLTKHEKTCKACLSILHMLTGETFLRTP